MSSLHLSLRPSLATYARLKIDPVSGEATLLFPEGLFILNDTAHEIVRRCDGRTTVREILDQLIEQFDVEEETAQNDLFENLEQLKQRSLIVFFE